jgi:signal transduction histidine kinase
MGEDEKGLDPAEIRSLLDVGRGLVSEWRPEQVLRQVLETARELTGARYAALGVLDDSGRGLSRFETSGIDDETRARIGDLPRGHGILGELIRDPRPLRLSHLSEHPRSYGFPSGHPSMETFLGVPIVIRGEAFGNLYLTEKEGGGEFDEQDEQLASMLSDWAAIAIDNARSHERERLRALELEQALKGMRATVSLNRELTGVSDLERIFELVTKRGRALVGARDCALALIDAEDSLRLVAAAGEGDLGRPRNLDSESGPLRRALRSGESVLVDASTLEELDLGGRTGIVAPLRIRGRSLGALLAVDRSEEAAAGFDDDDVLSLSTFAVSAATAIGATQQVEEEKRRLSIASSERERARWARELHDETLQELGALRMLQESALRVDDPETMKRALAQASERVEGLIGGLQGLITELRPAALDQLGVAAAIESLIDRIASRGGPAVEVDIDLPAGEGAEARLDPELEATVYRIVQESLHNVVKHAEANHVRVVVEARDDRIGITVSDDGRGLNGGGSREPSLGFGLIGLRERASLVGGSLEVGDAPGHGTRVTADLPLLRRG